MRNAPLTAALLLAAALCASGASLDELAQYCHPENRATKVAPPQWLPDESAYAEVSPDGRSIVLISPDKGTQTAVLLSLSDTRETQLPADAVIDGFILSPDGRKVIVRTDSEPVYRRSFTARHWVYDTHSRILQPLSTESERQMIPAFSPDSRMVAFATPDGNLRLRKLDYGTEIAVTADGQPGTVTNGVPDWTYEEEFWTTSSLAWAPDNLTLCFLRYDQSRVPLYNLPLYESVCEPDAARAGHPGTLTYHYPLAGEPNSTVTLHSYDIETRRTRQVDLLKTVPDLEYVPAIAYAGSSSETLVVAALNRDQNRFDLVAVNPRSTTSRLIYTDRVEGGWVEPICYMSLRCYDDFLVTATDRSGWTRLVEVTYSGAVGRALTPDGQDATDYYGYDPVKRLHWWQSTGGDPLNRVVGSTDTKGSMRTASEADATAQAWFSPSMKYALACYDSPTVPPLYTLVNAAGGYKTIRTLEDNAGLKARYAAMPRPRFVTLPAQADAPALNGYVVEAADGRTGKPVIMFQYSGPGSQEVRRRWSVDWMHYYAQQGYVVVCFDGRGTGGRGAAFRQSVYRRLGQLETADQLRAAAWAAQLPGVDPRRIGIFGWSYGGYEALMAATAPGNPYKAACATAPVSDWRFYDTVYTERYMLTPAQNPDGYAAAAPLARATSLSCPLLLMHGTADDNVHPCNSLDFAARLIADGRFCDMLLFPGMNHSINGCNTRAMVYWRMLAFFNTNL